MIIIFFFNDTATTEIYTLSLHDALPICTPAQGTAQIQIEALGPLTLDSMVQLPDGFTCDINDFGRSEEHTSELQSQSNLVCRLLLEKKKNNTNCLLKALIRILAIRLLYA